MSLVLSKNLKHGVSAHAMKVAHLKAIEVVKSCHGGGRHEGYRGNQILSATRGSKSASCGEYGKHPSCRGNKLEF